MSRQYDGNFGDWKPPTSASTPPGPGGGPFTAIEKAFPYCTITSDRSGSKREITTHGDLSRGDPGACHGIQQPNGSGMWWNERGVCEQRNYNGSISGTEGPVFSYGNAARSESFNGVSSSRAHEQVSHSTKGQGGSPDVAQKPGRGVSKSSCDAANIQVTGGDGGYAGGGNFAVSARECTLKAAGNMTLGCKGTGSFSSEGTFSVGSEQGCLALGGQGVAIGAAKQLSMGTTGIMSLYSSTAFLYSMGGVFINSMPGPTNVATNGATGKQGTSFQQGVKIS